MTKHKYICKECGALWGFDECILDVGSDTSIPNRCPYASKIDISHWERVETTEM